MPTGALAALLAALLCSVSQIHAGAADDEIYDEAVAAFEAGRNEAALAGFSRLRAAGRDDPALDFNLGAVLYRLEDYLPAIDAFERAAREPRLAALSFYNAALSAWRRNDRKAAAGWLERARGSAPEPGLASLVRELEATMSPARSVPPPSGLAYAAIGHDSNVTLRAEDETLTDAGQGDAWLEVYGNFDYASPRLSAAAISFQGSAWLLAHEKLSEYDTVLFRLGVTHGRDLGAWRIDVGARLERTLADGSAFSRGEALRLEAVRARGADQRLRFGLETGRIRESKAEFDYLAGFRHAFEAESWWRLGTARLRAFYRYEDNDRRDFREPIFVSVSPRRHELGGDITFPLAGDNAIRFGLRHRRSHYADANELVDGDQLRRKDHRTAIHARLSHRLESGREIALELQHTANHSNLAAYDYRQTGISLGLLVPW